MKLPEDFVGRTQELLGKETYKDYVRALEGRIPVSIRRNPFKTKMFDGKCAIESVPWCATGCYFVDRPNFTFDPLLHAGCYYVQEASSMFLDCVLRQYVKCPSRMLDLCAAPGGKSTLACGALPEGSLLFCNEPIRNRAQILLENMQKFGVPNVVVTSNYPSEYGKAGLLFDIILCDVPCSGEGMFRKDERAIAEWSLPNVKKCCQRQREIVGDVWECLREGGLLIYSTCTLNVEENEENVRWISETFDAEIVPVEIEKGWNITGSLLASFDKPVYRFIPGKTVGEGLFMAVVRKKTSGERDRVCNEERREQKLTKKKGCLPTIAVPLTNKQDFQVVQKGAAYYAIPHVWKDVYDMASNELNIIHAGIKLGTKKGKEIIPDQSLALSVCLDGAAFYQTEVNYEDAIAYLRKESLTLPADTPRGIVLLTYRQHSLGFVKNVGNRANNLYPQEWRIKSTHIPDEENTLQIR